MKKLYGFYLLMLFVNLGAMDKTLADSAASKPEVAESGSAASDSCVVDLANIERLIKAHVSTEFAELAAAQKLDEQRISFWQRCRRKCSQWSQKTKDVLALVGIGGGIVAMEGWRKMTGDQILPDFYAGAAGLWYSSLTAKYGAWKKMLPTALAVWFAAPLIYYLYNDSHDAMNTPTNFLLVYLLDTVYRHISRKMKFADLYVVHRLRANLPTEIFTKNQGFNN